MEPVSFFIALAVMAWAGQSALGWLQIRRFNRALADLAGNGLITVGRSTGRFRPRVVVVLSLSDDLKIVGNVIMKGVTVFARPRADSALTGKSVAEIRPEIMFPYDKALQQALTLAISNKR